VTYALVSKHNKYQLTYSKNKKHLESKEYIYIFFGLSLKGLQVILDASKLSPWLALKLDNHIQIGIYIYIYKIFFLQALSN